MKTSLWAILASFLITGCALAKPPGAIEGNLVESQDWVIESGKLPKELLLLKADSPTGRRLGGLTQATFLNTCANDRKEPVVIVSPPFTVTPSRPFLNVRAAGGKDVANLKIELEIGGQVVRTKTGPGSLTFSPLCFDMSRYVGSEAKLRLTNSSQDTQRGYLFVESVKQGNRPDTPQQVVLETIVQRAKDKYNAPGIVAGMCVDGEIVACVANGVRKLGDPTLIEITDSLMVGSISKVLTGTVIAKCVHDGKIAWSDTLESCLPDLARQTQNPVKKATLQQFTTHTSGLAYDVADKTNDPNFAYSKYPNAISFRREQIRRSLSLFPSVGVPGEKEVYSNLGPNITGTMVEAKTGKTFDSLIQEVLVSDFGIRSLTFGDPGKDKGTPTCPRGHVFSKDGEFKYMGWPGKDFADIFWRSALFGGMSVSCIDVLRFGGQLAMENVPGKPEYDKAFFDDIFLKRVGNSSRSNTGWEIVGPALHHSGNTGRGEWAAMHIIREKKAATFAYCNMNYKDQSFNPGNDLQFPMFSYIYYGKLPEGF